LSLPIIRCLFERTFAISSIFLCYFYIATQSSFSLSIRTPLVSTIFSYYFNNFSCSFLSFCSASLSLLIYCSMRLIKVFSILPSSSSLTEFYSFIFAI
jgi:hypothetical protein